MIFIVCISIFCFLLFAFHLYYITVSSFHLIAKIKVILLLFVLFCAICYYAAPNSQLHTFIQYHHHFIYVYPRGIPRLYAIYICTRDLYLECETTECETMEWDSIECDMPDISAQVSVGPSPLHTESSGVRDGSASVISIS